MGAKRIQIGAEITNWGKRYFKSAQGLQMVARITSRCRTFVRSLLSSVKVTEIHAGFLPFIPKPITEYPSVYILMLNFVTIVKQLDSTNIL